MLPDDFQLILLISQTIQTNFMNKHSFLTKHFTKVLPSISSINFHFHHLLLHFSISHCSLHPQNFPNFLSQNSSDYKSHFLSFSSTVFIPKSTHFLIGFRYRNNMLSIEASVVCTSDLEKLLVLTKKKKCFCFISSSFLSFCQAPGNHKFHRDIEKAFYSNN
jgi:hypothetical protein